MIRVLVSGALGRMGSAVCDAVTAQEDMQLVAMVDTDFASQEMREVFTGGEAPVFATLAEALGAVEADVAVDFTVPDVVFDNVSACLERGVHCVVGTTGLDEGQLAQLEIMAETGDANCLVAPNFAIGAVLMMEASRHFARHLPDCEIIELHHDRKLDAPSGTALRTADLIAEGRAGESEPPGPEGSSARGFIYRGTPIHSVRLPGLIAHQEVVFGGLGQTLSIRHDSISRESFMPGVMLAVRKVAALEGLVTGLENVLEF